MSNYILLIIILVIIGLIMIYDKYTDNHVFIHVPKNAGTSMRNILKNKNSDIPITYVGHKYPKKYPNEIVVIRDPIERLISAFYYSKQKWPNKFNQLFDNPNEFVEAWSDHNDIKHDIANSIVSNEKNKFKIRNSNYTIKLSDVNHTVLGKRTPYIWTYMPQSTWFVNNPKYVIRHNHLEKDFNSVLKSIGYKKYVKIPKLNKSVHRNRYLSDKSKQFLYKFYESDYKLLKKYNL